MRPSAYKWDLAKIQDIVPEPERKGPYPEFNQINGQHPWKHVAPLGYVEYQARILRGSKVVYFNFNLAREMGLLPKDHPNKLNKALEKTLVETFALRIINEHDQLMGERFPLRDVKPHRYMATRYLQLQHKSKSGTTSGDGRSIWNGCMRSQDGVSWDVSSCGTGVTCLSPAVALEGRPIKTGDKKVSYGSGTADVDEGLTAAILSEIVHARGILTERTLLILESPDGHAVNVRAAKNLLRPSHLFLHLKQGNQLMLKAALDYFIHRQVENKDWTDLKPDADKYDYFLRRIAERYGDFTAALEDEYIFCWLDWDGDNMLMDAGIIDYGSIRLMGLCHHNYRYDDVDRFSTNLKEQKRKARYLVQTFAQMVDFVRTGNKKEIREFKNAPCLKHFDQANEKSMRERLLRRMGLSARQVSHVLEHAPAAFRRFELVYRHFERRCSGKGMRLTPDGINDPVVFSMHAFLRELPRSLLLKRRQLSTEELIEHMYSKHLTKKMLAEERQNKRSVSRLQATYLDVIKAAGHGKKVHATLISAAMRAAVSNPMARVTGDGIIYVVDYLLSHRRQVNRSEFLKVVDAFIHKQNKQSGKYLKNKASGRILRVLDEICLENKDSI